jgi:hypothetical protein
VDYQLRIYTARAGAMGAWVGEWRRHVEPLRRRFGFEVIGPWVMDEEDRFVWILGYAGEDGWDAADDAYYASAERRAIDPDPARHLLQTEHRMMRPA